ncbi:GMP reductase [Rhodoplanes elegans]|uniref:GMP reductase n=1 Tax=Rhodoplanes elegans TaxID=29408 RepID=A0A327JRA0_9BRAD|nr:GMP reductase [Rhodoplanes elegans]MBK5958312.1 GMP reductase [Rhodoplanes elegans]RAI28116.1 GMP reductase [Rhodoplanes elegans]
MHIETDPKLDFKDVLIRPKRSTLNSRSEVDINRTFRFVHTGHEWTGFPLIAANMDTVGTFSMAQAFQPFGAMVALHKHYPAERLIEFFRTDVSKNAFYSIGITSEDLDKLAFVRSQVPVTKICMDVANGYSEQFLQTVKRVRDDNKDAVIMAGAIVTGEMAEALILAGADIVKVGIGSGSVCTTRDLTGVGYPQLSAVIECADAAHGLRGHVCSDGGCTVPGDVAKAFGGGADFVMLGGMLAGHDECEGRVRHELRDGESVAVGMEFYGMSSETAMNRYHGGVADYRASEGKTVEVTYRGPVKATLQGIMGGLRSAMTYMGATRLKEVPKRTTFVLVGAQRNTVFD